MTRPLNDTEYIFGLHDPGGEELMLDAKRPGWIVFSETIGRDPDDETGFDYSYWSEQGLGIIVRLNHGHDPDGTIPLSQHYEDFAQRCANYVANSQSCHIWIIGNEMNFPAEQPKLEARNVEPVQVRAADDASDQPTPTIREQPQRFSALGSDQAGNRSVEERESITPALYTRCYRLCRKAIGSKPGHESDQVLVGAVAPWNNQTRSDENQIGDWVRYFEAILSRLGPDGCDGFALHAYTHGADPDLVSSDTKMEAPFADRHYHFRVYQDFLAAVPLNMRHLPAYITETDQDQAWQNENSGWVRKAYGEINRWNKDEGHQQVRALVLFRWRRKDKWYIEAKKGVIDDFRRAMRWRHRWQQYRPAYMAVFQEGGDIKRARPGELLAVSLKIRNGGSKTWRRRGSKPVRIGFRWTTLEGEPVPVDDARESRTPLPRDVKPGQSVTIDDVPLAVPNRTGQFELRWDLVEEGVSWFRDQGNPEYVHRVTVEPDPSEQGLYIEITEKWIRGPFLERYRAAGLDIVGLPITEQYVDPVTGFNTQYFQRVSMEETPPGQVRFRLAGQEALEAQSRIAQLTQEIEQLKHQVKELIASAGKVAAAAAAISPVPRPQVTNIADQLPRDPSGYAQRERQQIRHVVINHTGGPASLSVERLASYHQERGYPGIAYHYIIDGEGGILQSNAWTDTVSNAGYLGQGLNVAIAGKFDDAAPPASQIEATARLCAWILQELGLDMDDVKGVTEFVNHGSPGWQWLHGQRYKDDLIEGIRSVRVQATPEEPDRDPDQEGDSAQQEERILELETKLRAREDELADTQIHLGRMEEQLAARDRRIADLLGQLGGAAPSAIEKPNIHDVVDDLKKHPAKSYRTRSVEEITHICIHHSAVSGTIPLESVADYHVDSRGWPGIGYHYYIKPDGTIYQVNRQQTESYHVAHNNHYTVGVCVAGDFTYAIPLETQLDSAAQLVAWLMQELNVSEEHIMGHKEFPRNDTSCPGVTWLKNKQWKALLLQQVRSLQGIARSKGIYHYLLFWQKQDDWARQDWNAAQKYIGRFRPSAGFSVDDAANAEVVTIVGGVAGVPYETEVILRKAGSRVERLEGRDFADTKRILDDLAARGERFFGEPA
ncbi:MAG: peptidoglycan recognition family protein [Chloroflexota bacterium]|nr:peptidoglycan recognition family protein [Chloroflexota bacterium]